MGLFSSRFPVLERSSRQGRKHLDRLAARGSEIVDDRTARRAGRIVETVRRRGDEGLRRMVRRHDGVDVSTIAELRRRPEEIDPGSEELPVGFAEALERSIAAVERYHEAQVLGGFTLREGGVEIEERRVPLTRVGVYVPGGRVAYPSTAVMTVVPARAAGVESVVVVTPPRAYEENAALRYTLARLEVDEIWSVGGAQAVAALAYGTETIERVDKIVGPGNRWVTAAKRLVAGDVGVESFAGPTEVVVVATADVDSGLVAADLLAQAEHDPLAAAVLVTPSTRLANRVRDEIVRQLEELPDEERRRTAGDSLDRFGAALVVDDMEEAASVVERIAPEHLQLVGEEAEDLVHRPLPAAAIFVGTSTPEVFGDYLAGPSHVLPTCGSARYASVLGVEDFVRRSHVVRFDPGAASRMAAAAVSLAEAEGLVAHAAAALRRLR